MPVIVLSRGRGLDTDLEVTQPASHTCPCPVTAGELECAPGPEGAVAVAAEAKALREANVAFLKRARCGNGGAVRLPLQRSIGFDLGLG